jgi:DNA-binding GntR family transcriptional regulator
MAASDNLAEITPPLSELPLAERAYRLLVEAMHRGELAAGQQINRRAIAERFGMSVAPVLEAMVRLEHEGLLQTEARKSTLVRAFTIEEMRDQLQLREAVECQAAWLYSRRGNLAANLTAMQALARKIDQADDQDLSTLWQADIAFHRGLVALAESQSLLKTFDRVMTLGLFAAISHAVRVHDKKDRHCHGVFLSELNGAEPEKAVMLVRRHLHGGKSPILDHLS